MLLAKEICETFIFLQEILDKMEGHVVWHMLLSGWHVPPLGNATGYNTDVTVK